MDMSRTAKTPNTASTLPNVRRTILRGVWLGIQASLLGSAVFLVTDLLLVTLVDPWVDVFDLGTIDAGLLFWLSVFVLAGFFVAIVPGVVGAGVISIMQRTLVRHGRCSARLVSVLGILVGTCSGCFAILIARQLEPEMVQGSSVEAFIAALLSAALAGWWHSWRFARWLQKAVTQS